ncbi:hypothetical protein GCM10020254_02900 [Streptomyces goshikiensis]
MFSFYATKVIAAGEGGMLLQRDPAAREHVRGYQDPGAREVYAPRFNHRLSDPAAALALSQFRRLDEIAAHRRAVAARYTAALPPHVAPPAGAGPPARCPTATACGPPAAPSSSGGSATCAPRASRPTPPLIPARHLLHRQLGLEPREYPVAERVVDSTVSVPLFAALTEEQADRVAEALTGLPD